MPSVSSERGKLWSYEALLLARLEVPASFNRRFLNSSESCAPIMRQASVTFGHA